MNLDLRSSYSSKELKNWPRPKLSSIWPKLLSFYVEQSQVPCERFGSAYGGWTICPVGLNEKTIVYSLGIGEDITFDLDLIEKFGCQVFAFDPTPRSLEWLKAQELPGQFRWYGIGVANYDGTAEFYPPENANHISHSILFRPKTSKKAVTVNVNKLGTIVKRLGHHYIDILKMDIEGAEYNVIKDMLQTKIFPKQILVEFHHFFRSMSILQTIRTTILLWLKGYKIFSVSENGNEYSFILKSSLK